MSVPVTSYIDFEILKESWNIYRLSDGSRLYARVILISVLNTGFYDNIGKPVYQPIFMSLFAVRAPRELKGVPTVPQPEPRELMESSADVQISRAEVEDWNVYRLENGATLKTKLVITSIKRSSKYDQLGEPIYLINSTPVTDIEFPNTLLKRIEK